MPGHEDPKCEVLKDDKGLAYVKIIREENPEFVVEKVDGDLNGDGKFDEKDKSIAGKVLAKGRKKKIVKKK